MGRYQDHPQRNRDQHQGRAQGEVTPPAATGCGHWAADYLVGSADDRGRGLGPEMLDAVTRLTFTERPDAPYVLVAVVAANRRSWRALEKAGFRIVGSGDAEPDNPVDLPLHHVLRRDRLPGE
ncbi:MAG: GNAT family N-acetyltransferase [Actinomycetales bacterium]|nr:MAG: GNAT family N-acetyltransferase [Actinomycetales bacterium]